MLKIDLSAFERAAKDLNAKADQVPFALSRSLNDAARATYTGLTTNTWPNSITVRKPGFIKWALRTQFSTKNNLSININDTKANGRGHLALHDTGGVKKAAKRLAVPTSNVRRGSTGVVKSQRPIVLSKSFRKGDVIYQRIGTKKKPALKLMYVLKSSAMIKKDVPFSSDFERMMKAETAKAFTIRIAEAMATRR